MNMKSSNNVPGISMTVLKNEQENSDIISLYLEGDDMALKNRTAGQYLSLRIQQDDNWSEPHPFTISCAPEDDHIRLTIKKAGEFTSSIPDLAPGTPVKCTGPFGTFCKDIESKENIAMIAGGVGITPFLSVLRHFRHIEADNRSTLFWTSRTRDDVFAVKELEDMVKALNLTIIHTLSRDKQAETYFNKNLPEIRYITGYANREVLATYLDISNTAFYLCGPPSMQNFVLDELKELGVDRNTVEIESFALKK